MSMEEDMGKDREDAPDRIWAVIGYDQHDAHSGERVVTGEFHTVRGVQYGNQLEYVHADIHDALVEENARLREALVKIANTPCEMIWGEDAEVAHSMNTMEAIAEAALGDNHE